MKFEEVFNIIFDVEKKQEELEQINFVGFQPKTAKMLSFFWNMLAILGPNKIEDMVYIDSKNNIISIPLKEKKIKGDLSKPSETGEVLDGAAIFE